MEVRVYTSPLCQPCRATKRVLTGAGIPFVAIDLTEPQHAAKLADLKAAYGDPLKMPVVEVIDMGSTYVWQEFRPDLLEETIQRYRARTI
jgi:glutaredoxin